MNESTMLELMSMASCYTAMSHLEDVIATSAIPLELRECFDELVKRLITAERGCMDFVEAGMLNMGE